MSLGKFAFTAAIASSLVFSVGAASADDNKTRRSNAEAIINDDATSAHVALTCSNTTKKCTKQVTFAAGSLHYIKNIFCYARVNNGVLTEAFALTQGGITLDLENQWERTLNTVTRYNMGTDTQLRVDGNSTMTLNVWYSGNMQEAYCTLVAEIWTASAGQ